MRNINKFIIIEDRRYDIEELKSGWFDLKCDGNHVAKLINEEECRRVIWSYWTNLGLDIEIIKENDFTDNI